MECDLYRANRRLLTAATETPTISSARPPSPSGSPIAICEVPAAPVSGTSEETAGKQADALMWSSIRVTSPLRANMRPSTVTAEPTVIEVIAITVPAKVAPSKVAKLPTCQKTLQAEAPPVNETELVPVIRLEPV